MQQCICTETRAQVSMAAEFMTDTKWKVPGVPWLVWYVCTMGGYLAIERDEVLTCAVAQAILTNLSPTGLVTQDCRVCDRVCRGPEPPCVVAGRRMVPKAWVA